MSIRLTLARLSCAVWTVGCLLLDASPIRADALAVGSKRFNRPLNALDAAAVERAKAGAARKLRDPECLKLLVDFHDRQGRPLSEALGKWGVGAAEYLEMIPFLDGASSGLCRWSTAELVSTPGKPRVFVCTRFSTTQSREPWRAEAIVIHEMLHTLGLGENPPTSTEITRRVLWRCR